MVMSAPCAVDPIRSGGSKRSAVLSRSNAQQQTEDWSPGGSLHRNGRVFLVANFHAQEQLADSVNHLLLVGFYLINIGFVCLALRYGDKPTEIVGAIEFLSTKVGLVIVLLGVMHFFNIRMLVRFRGLSLFASIAPDVATA
jgi:hypothetical protein